MKRKFWFYGILGMSVAVVSCASPPPVELPLPIEQPLVVEEPAPVVSGPSLWDRLMQGILSCLEVGDFDGALALFDEFPEEDAKTAAIRLLKASVNISAGRLPESRELINGVIQDEPENADAFYSLFMVEAVAGNRQAQRNALEQALKINENHVPALIARGNMYLGSDSLRLAAAQFDKALTIEPDNLEALTGKASVHRYQKQPEEAMTLANQAVERYPGKLSGYALRAQLFRDAGQMDRALDDLAVAEGLAPTDYWICYDKGRALLALNRRDEALDAFERAITLDKNEFAAYIYSAGIFADNEDYGKAEERYRALIRLNPDYFYAYESLGVIKMKNKEYAAARDAFLAAYAKVPEENSYAVLAALNALRVQKQFEVKPFLESAMRLAKRDTLDYAVLRMLNDFNGDANVARQIEAEKNMLLKSRSAFYLAEFYDICNKPMLANAYYEKCREVNRRDTIEWRLNQWKMEERNLIVQAKGQNLSPEGVSKQQF
jgi:tetratricopeptide (TPR) repeat protein